MALLFHDTYLITLFTLFTSKIFCHDILSWELRFPACSSFPLSINGILISVFTVCEVLLSLSVLLSRVILCYSWFLIYFFSLFDLDYCYCLWYHCLPVWWNLCLSDLDLPNVLDSVCCWISNKPYLLFTATPCLQNPY